MAYNQHTHVQNMLIGILLNWALMKLTFQDIIKIIRPFRGYKHHSAEKKEVYNLTGFKMVNAISWMDTIGFHWLSNFGNLQEMCENTIKLLKKFNWISLSTFNSKSGSTSECRIKSTELYFY